MQLHSDFRFRGFLLDNHTQYHGYASKTRQREVTDAGTSL